MDAANLTSDVVTAGIQSGAFETAEVQQTMRAILGYVTNPYVKYIFHLIFLTQFFMLLSQIVYILYTYMNGKRMFMKGSKATQEEKQNALANWQLDFGGNGFFQVFRGVFLAFVALIASKLFFTLMPYMIQIIYTEVRKRINA